MRYSKDEIKQAREYRKEYIKNPDEILGLVNSINSCGSDFNKIKRLLSDSIAAIFQSLPTQHSTLKQNVFKAFCMMVKNAETNIYLYGAKTTLSYTNGRPPSRSGVPFSQRIPALNNVVKIAVDEWISNWSMEKEKADNKFHQNNEDVETLTHRIAGVFILNDYLQEPMFEAIDRYFATFKALNLSLMELVFNYHTKNDIYSDELERNAFLFQVDPDTVKKRVSIEINSNNGNMDIIQRYITDKYNTIKSSLLDWGKSHHGYKIMHFPILKGYVNTTPKLFFFGCVEFFGTKDNPIQPTIGDFYNKILQELEIGYNAIVALFTNALNAENTTNQQEVIRASKLSQKQTNILFEELSGCFEPYDKEHFKYAFNGGSKPNGYNGLRLLAPFTDTQMVYLIAGLFTDGATTNWSTAKEFGIENAAQKKTNYMNNKTKKPKGAERIDKILQKIKR